MVNPSVMLDCAKEQIRKLIKPEDVLYYVGAKHLSYSRGEIRCPCPIHKGDGENFSYDINKGVWKCWSHSCGEDRNKPRDEFLLVEICKGIGFVQAIKELGQLVGVQVDMESEFDKEKYDSYLVQKWLKARQRNMEVRTNDVLDEAILQKFNCGISNNYILSRDMDDCTVKSFEIGFTDTPLDEKEYDIMRKSGVQYPGRMIVPIRNERNDLVGFSGRLATDNKTALDTYHKYRNAVDFQKGAVLYNLNKVTEILDIIEYPLKNSIVLVEGYLDVIRAWQYGGYNFIATMGTSMMKEQIELLVQHTSTVVLAYDNDDAGIKARKRIYDQLKNYCDVYEIVFNKKDVGELTFNEFWDSYINPRRYHKNG